MKVAKCDFKIIKIDLQRPLQTTIELEFTDSGVVVLNLATRNAKSKAQFLGVGIVNPALAPHPPSRSHFGRCGYGVRGRFLRFITITEMN